MPVRRARKKTRSFFSQLSAAETNLGAQPAMDVLTKKVKEEPLLFTFLGLTVAALGGGLRSLATGDNRASQTMMRARVFFQLCTVCTLVGTVYWKAYTGETSACVVGVGSVRGPRAPLYLSALPLTLSLPLLTPRPPLRSHGQEPPRGRRAARLPH